MRMLFTDEHPLINLIQGHTIISDPKLYRSSYIDPEDPETSDYPLKRILYEQCVDVVFMVDWFRVYGGKTIGFHAAHHRSWRQTLKNKHVICVVQDDPFVWETWFGRKVYSHTSVINPLHHKLPNICRSGEKTGQCNLGGV